MTRTLVRQRGARALSAREMRVLVDAGTRWAWQLEDALAAIYEAQILAVYDQAARLLARTARPVTGAGAPAGWTIPDPDELGLSLSSQMDDRHARRQAGDDASDAIRVDAVHRVTAAGLQAMGINLSLRNPLVEGVLRDQLGGKITGIRETTRRDVMASLEASWKAGDSIPRAARALRASAPEIAASRSRTIARTEMLAAVNGGAHALASISNEAALSSGEPALLKIWLCADDEKVRDTHGFDGGAAETYGPGGGIPMDEPFLVGDSELQYPGDPDGAASEVINCRCALSYEEAGEAAPADTTDAVAEGIEETPEQARARVLAESDERIARRAADPALVEADRVADERIARLEALRSVSPDDLRAQIAEEQALAPSAEAVARDFTPPPTAVEDEIARRAARDEIAKDEAAAAREMTDLIKAIESKQPTRDFTAPAGNAIRVGQTADDWDEYHLTRMFSSEALDRDGLVTRTESYHYGHQIAVNAFISTPKGGEVAELARSIDLANHVVQHDSFFMSPEWQGKGIAKDLMRSAVKQYDEAGIDRVTVLAAGQNGRYTWARFGFDFQNDASRARMRAHFEKVLARQIGQKMGADSSPESVERLKEAHAVGFARIAAAEHSWDFAGMSVPGIAEDFGKRAMIEGPEWSGWLDLKPGSEGRKVFDDYTR